MTGGTRQLVDAFGEGAATQDGVALVVRRADEAGPADLVAADAVLFATPENLASMAGMMKDFFDRSYYPALGRVEGKPYATLVCAGSDGQGAARQIARIATGWRMKPVAAPLVVITHAQTPEAIMAPKRIEAASLARARELGAAMAAAVSMGIW
ncbi:MAG: flavodoxin family protein [Lautropia sp.]|nr:MAG: flavodoxin family protein [Pseudomonadota bacterium]MBC6958386.1 flavodoxin family protein [Lautropia sp.]MCL4701369.1 NAD(P)H-dependent oxidoreductase [Burkholderiaceae bacterium]MDL1909024.1 flavodoxin family protein [Betaproteobacteria bacterium PRO1]RIK85849.1 MAG: flavodoxin [Burkholderiales bacterium]